VRLPPSYEAPAEAPEQASEEYSGPPADARSVIDRGLRSLLRRRFGHAPLRFSLEDGTDLFDSGPDRVATVLLRDRATLLSILIDPEREFGDAYSKGRIEVRGDLVAALEAAYRAVDRVGSETRRRGSRGGHSLRESRANVHRHYDLGNDFYRLWLDDQLVYTCAYFKHPGMSLEEGQVAKLDRVCRKLLLRPGERVVEAGCGWGALALHMARRYGVSVRAYNVSAEQVRYARARADKEGLSTLVEFVEDDYRSIVGRFDAFVSLGMIEHVGTEDYGRLASVIRGGLDPTHGRGLLHFIGRDRARALNSWIRTRIFPGAYPPTLAEVVNGVLEPAAMSVLDVENLRPHYADTLAHWRARFEAAGDAVVAEYGEEFRRAWRLYLAGSEAGFRTGSLQLFQVVFGGECGGAPWSRG
jgi:cyclopropane-fatty-acyl-phospholipid synthase